MGGVNVGIRVEGAAKLRKELRRAGRDLSELKAANLAAANVVLPYATAAAPRRTGRLAASIRVGATSSAGVIRAGFKRRTPYGPIIHFGWPARHIPAKPWITDAATDHEAQWVRVYMDHVQQILNTL